MKNFREILNVIQNIIGIVILIIAFSFFVQGIFLGSSIFAISGLIIFNPSFNEISKSFKESIVQKVKWPIAMITFILGFLVIVNSPKGQGFEFREKYNMSEEEFNSLSQKQQDSLKKHVDSIQKVKENEEYAKNYAEEKAAKIKSQFNEATGEHIELGKLVRISMYDPYSFEAIKTSYIDNGTSIYVTMQYRGKNAFGALVVENIEASCDLNGKVIKIFKQY